MILLPNPKYLTHPNIPKPLHGVNPRTIKGQAWWDVKRQEAYSENDYCCWACGIHKSQADYHQWLEAHEEYEINYETGEVKLKNIIALCHSCHNFIHSGRLFIMFQKGKYSREKILDILARGFGILAESSLEPYEGTRYIWLLLHGKESDFVPKEKTRQSTATWKDWHLVIDGEKHYSPYESMEEWQRHYATT